MNPQYAQPTQFGVPSQNFPPNRSSPSLGPPPGQSFQNVPLGPSKPGQPLTGPPPPQPGAPPSYVPSSSPMSLPVSGSGNMGAPSGQFPPGMGPPRSQIPPSQLPPGHDQRPPSGPAASHFGQPPTSKPAQNGPPQMQNGPQQFQNGPPQFQGGSPQQQLQNGPGFGAPPPTSLAQQGQLPPGGPTKLGGLTSNMPPLPQQGSNQFAPSQSGQNQPPKATQPPLSSQPPLSGQAPNQSPFPVQPPPPGQPPASGHPPLPGPPGPGGQPPLSGQPGPGGQPPQPRETSFRPSIPGQPGPGGQPPLPGQGPLGSSIPGQPPIQGQPPLSSGQSFQNTQPPNRGPTLGQPPLSAHPGQPPFLGQPPLNKHPNSGHPPLPVQPSLNTQPQHPGQPPFNTQHPNPGQPPLPGQPSLNTQPQHPGQPPFNTQHPNPGQPPLPGQPSLNTQPQHPGQPPFNTQHPNPGQPPLPGQPFLNTQPQHPGQPPFNTQHPHSGQPPLATQPPHPGQPFNSGQPPNQFNQAPPPDGPSRLPAGPGQFGQPPLPGQPPLNQYQGPNQLANQVQGMNLGGPRQYPGGPMKNAMNGEGGPHMPPPLSQQQYMNGQQMRAPPGPGYPPMPGQQPPVGATAYPQPNYPQAAMQQPKRLDPDQMPSPIQVTQDDQQNRSGIFCTNQKGLVPPLVTTNFIVQDQGNASPRFIRSTMYNVPVSQDIMKQTAVPFSLIISPMARIADQEYPPPIVNFGDLGPVRCIRCKAYMCPYMQFIDSGRRFQCLFCKATTDVPTEYFQHLDHTGQRLDRYERPELVLGAYEFVATTDYCRNNTMPKPPAVVFIIDVSYNNIKSGLVHLLCSQMKEIIQNLPVDQGQEKSNMKVGFITYNSAVHFYNIKGTLAAPQMLIVGDTQEMFMPLLDGFLCTPEESGPVIDSLMQQIPAMFGDTRETETILLPAILAGLEALKASDCAGKLVVFHSTLPTAEAPGKLKNRDDRKLLATDKERTILTPQTQAYNQLGQDCVGAGCSVDLFVFNNAYIDVATISQVSRLSGGEVYKYTYFQADTDGERLIRDIITDISRPIAFDAIMRVRTSTGVRPTDFYGHFFMSNTTDMELAAIDCDKAVAVEIKHDDKLSEEEGVYIQAALLYTSCSGQRRLRVINLSLKTCSQMGDLYRSCDCDTIINYVSKQSTYKLNDNNPKAVKDNLVTRTAQILATYRKNCASPSSAGQLILPECMKLLPLYVNCLLKSDALSGGSDMTVDDRSHVMQEVMIMDIPTSVNYFYPRLIPVHELDPTQEPVEIPSPIRCTVDKMSEQGVYILENGIHMFLWIGLGANPDFIQKVFGAPSAIQVDIERTVLPELDNTTSLAVRNIIDEIRVQRHRCMRLTLVRQREKLEPVFKHFLAEDRGTDGSPSYVDFLIHMHKEIRTLLS